SPCRDERADDEQGGEDERPCHGHAEGGASRGRVGGPIRRAAPDEGPAGYPLAGRWPVGARKFTPNCRRSARRLYRSAKGLHLFVQVAVINGFAPVARDERIQ